MKHEEDPPKHVLPLSSLSLLSLSLSLLTLSFSLYLPHHTPHHTTTHHTPHTTHHTPHTTHHTPHTTHHTPHTTRHTPHIPLGGNIEISDIVKTKVDKLFQLVISEERLETLSGNELSILEGHETVLGEHVVPLVDDW